MKNLIFLLLLVFVFSACQNNTTSEIDTSRHPEALQKVFEKHGGYETWHKMHTLQYFKDSSETHYIDLKNRRDKIVSEKGDYSFGFDGTNIWVKADTTFKGNPAFMHNLYFYFYAMPFVLGDEGIIYKEAEPLEADSITYAGIHIQFENGVGQVSTDEYILYYHPETYQMTWLAYTVTFRTKERNDKFKWIKYNDWDTFNGVLLPKSFHWYNKEENGQFADKPRKSVSFEDIVVGEDPFDDSILEQPDGARVVEDE